MAGYTCVLFYHTYHGSNKTVVAADEVAVGSFGGHLHSPQNLQERQQQQPQVEFQVWTRPHQPLQLVGAESQP